MSLSISLPFRVIAAAMRPTTASATPARIAVMIIASVVMPRSSSRRAPRRARRLTRIMTMGVSIDVSFVRSEPGQDDVDGRVADEDEEAEEEQDDGHGHLLGRRQRLGF